MTQFLNSGNALCSFMSGFSCVIKSIRIVLLLLLFIIITTNSCISQVIAIAVLLYTPLVCVDPIVVPILACYAGVILRLLIVLVAFFRTVFPKMRRDIVVCLAALSFFIGMN